MNAARPILPPVAAAWLAEFERPDVLGASRQIEIAAALMASLAEEHDADNASLLHAIDAVATYLTALRGESSQAIPNALALMLAGLESQIGLPPTEFRASVAARVRGYAAEAQQRKAKIVAQGVALADGAARILAFDYSSTVLAILRALGETKRAPTIVIPEARSLDGGRRYVEELQDSRLALEYIPDAAIGSATQRCDLAFIGAETIAADGGCYNTTGSLLLALACRHWRVPLYVPSTLIKIDARTRDGNPRALPELDTSRLGRLTEGWSAPLRSRVHLNCPDLDFVPPNLITAFLTEKGVHPPAAIAALAARLENFHALR